MINFLELSPGDDKVTEIRRPLISLFAAIALGFAGLTVAASHAEAASGYIYLYSDSNFGGCSVKLARSNIPNFSARHYTGGCSNPTSHTINNNVSSVKNSSSCYVYLYPDTNYSGGYDYSIDPHTVDLKVPDQDVYSSMLVRCLA